MVSKSKRQQCSKVHECPPIIRSPFGTRKLDINCQWTWVSTDIPDNVPVAFVVNATNVADSSERIVMRTSQLNSVISFSDSTSCNNYSIQVVANNSAGQGPPSNFIIRSVPSLPEISAVEESLQHTLRRTSSGITLNFILDVRLGEWC